MSDATATAVAETPQHGGATPPAKGGRVARRRWASRWPATSVCSACWSLLIIIGAVTQPDLYGDSAWVWSNILSILQLASAVGVVTVGMTFVIIGGGIDLSVGRDRRAGRGLVPPRSPPRATAPPA